jgi:hypothetical protein
MKNASIRDGSRSVDAGDGLLTPAEMRLTVAGNRRDH